MVENVHVFGKVVVRRDLWQNNQNKLVKSTAVNKWE